MRLENYGHYAYITATEGGKDVTEELISGGYWDGDTYRVTSVTYWLDEIEDWADAAPGRLTEIEFGNKF